MSCSSIRFERVFSFMLALTVALAGGCSSGHATVDSSVVLRPGDTALVSMTGDEVRVSVVRTTPSGGATVAGENGSGRTSVVVLAGPPSAIGADGAWIARTSTPLAAGATVVQSTGGEVSGEHRVMLVNEGDTVATVSVHAVGAEGFSIVQPYSGARVVRPAGGGQVAPAR